MSHYKRYPAYKDSGVEWIGEVPEHWDVKRLRHIAHFTNSNVDKKHYDGQRAVSLCNYTDVYYNEFITPALPFMEATASEGEIVQFALQRGDVLITKDSEDPKDIGIPALVAEEMPGVICGYHLTVIRAGGLDTGRYLHRSIQSHPTKAHFFVESPGITRYGLSQDAIGDISVCLPPSAEQTAIAAALDCETARIDALIAKKTRFIELLKEKRQALLTHAVTKGLDPKVKMKDSGVEWIGVVPEHWSTYSAKRLFRERDERSVLGEEEMMTVSHLTGVTPRSEKQVNMFEAETTAGYKICRAGDLTINTLWAWMGAMGTARQVGIVSPAYNIYTPNEGLDPEFVDLLVRMPSFAKEVTRFSKGIRESRLRLYPEGFFEVQFAVPPLAEQHFIVNSVRDKAAQIESLAAKTQRSIDLLKERRSALITAAVTGQIDLREAA